MAVALLFSALLAARGFIAGGGMLVVVEKVRNANRQNKNNIQRCSEQERISTIACATLQHACCALLQTIRLRNVQHSCSCLYNLYNLHVQCGLPHCDRRTVRVKRCSMATVKGVL